MIGLNKDIIFPVALAVLSGFIGYRFNGRLKEQESFIQLLSKSYSDIYFPMYIRLEQINAEMDIIKRVNLLRNFFEMFSTPDSNIKLIASSEILEFYINLKKTFDSLNDIKDSGFWKQVVHLSTLIENECWDAHDIIYKDHLKFKTLINKNPLIRFVMELGVYALHLTGFMLWVSVLILYFTLCNYFEPINIVPSWWKVKDAILLFLMTFGLYLFVMVISSWYLSSRNRRKSTLSRLIYGRLNRIGKWVKIKFRFASGETAHQLTRHSRNLP